MMADVKRLGVYLKDYLKESILSPLFKLLEALMDLLVPLVVAYAINEGIGNGDNNVIIRCFVLLIALAIAGMLFSFTAQYFAAKASVGFATRLRQSLFDHILSLSYKELDASGSDTLISRMTSDINQLQTGVNMSLRLLLRSPFIVFGSMIMAFMIDVRSALIFVISIPVLSAVVFGIMYVSIPLFAKAQHALDKLLGITRENLSGVRVIRAFCKEDDEIREFDEKAHDLTLINEHVGRLSALMNPLTYVIVNIATIILIRYSAFRVYAGQIRQGDVVALYNYMAQIIVELIKLASLTITINRSIACGDRVAKILELRSSMSYKTEEIRQTGEIAVRFSDVSFAYNNSSADSLENASFEIRKKETVGIIGSTGSGKSTLANLICRFYDVDKGKVEVLGHDVKDYPQGVLLEKIGIVPQKAVLFEGSIRDNLKWGNESASDEDLYEAISIAQATEVIANKKDGLDEWIEQGGRNLSGGQRQRLTIARALVKKPEILIMDDSASALDFATDFRLRKAIRQLKDMTVFIVSQRCSSVKDADKILVLNDGMIVGQGSHEELLTACKTYQEIYYSQFPEQRPENKEVFA